MACNTYLSVLYVDIMVYIQEIYLKNSLSNRDFIDRIQDIHYTRNIVSIYNVGTDLRFYFMLNLYEIEVYFSIDKYIS